MQRVGVMCLRVVGENGHYGVVTIILTRILVVPYMLTFLEENSGSKILWILQ